MFEIKEINGKKVMHIPSGVHHIIKPIAITEDELQIVGEDGAVLRGTMPLSADWKPMYGGIFRTYTTQKADALYVNGVKYRMARYPKYNPNIDVFGGFAGDCISKEKADGWKNPKGGYIHAIHKHHWGGFSYEITGKDENGELCYIGGWQNNRQMGMHDEHRFVENIFEELTEPGEWHYDSDTGAVSVIPYPGHDLSTAEIAVNAAFFTLEGRSGVTIENLRFEKSSRTFMLTKEPLLRSDWTIYRGGAVYFKDCKNCLITDCTFEDIGSNAVFVDANSESVAVTKTLIRDIGASGVCFVGRNDAVRNPLFEYEETNHLDEIDLTPGPKSDNYPKNCFVDNCIICKVGQVEKQATGVEISMAYGISVTNCSIYDTSRAGLNISEGTFGGHRIEGCDVFDTVKETGDHGSFNSWGRDRFWHLRGLSDEEAYRYALLDCGTKPTVIANNRFRCDRGWDIDLDDGSSNFEIYNNLCLNGGIKLREGFYRKVYNNITVNNTVHTHAWYPNSGDVVCHNLLFTSYLPYAMPEKWGDRFDENYLYAANMTPTVADELSAVSGDDANSLKVYMEFADPQTGDYTLTHPHLPEFNNFMSEFGVKYLPLKAIRKEPILPEIKLAVTDSAKVYRVHSIDVKNIDTDGEMSVYGTAGHIGALVVSTNVDPGAVSKGLLEGDVIVSCGETPINCVKDFENCTDVYSKKLGVIRKQKLMML